MGADAKRRPTISPAPLLNQPPVLSALLGLRAPVFDATAAIGLERNEADVVVIDGGNHALEVDDPAASARNLADVLVRLRHFVSIHS